MGLLKLWLDFDKKVSDRIDLWLENDMHRLFVVWALILIAVAVGAAIGTISPLWDNNNIATHNNTTVSGPVQIYFAPANAWLALFDDRMTSGAPGLMSIAYNNTTVGLEYLDHNNTYHTEYYDFTNDTQWRNQ